MDALFTRLNIDGDGEFKNAGFSSMDYALNNVETDLLSDQFNDMRNDIVNRVDKYTKEGSGWVLCKIISFKLFLYRFNLNYGGQKTELPYDLQQKRCVINIDSNNCFKWAVLAALHHHEIENQSRATAYTQWENDYTFPTSPITSVKDVIEFVKQK